MFDEGHKDLILMLCIVMYSHFCVYTVCMTYCTYSILEMYDATYFASQQASECPQ